MFDRTRTCTFIAAACGTALPALAQQQLERVEITGSSIKRIEAETALPVQIITRDEIAKSGAINTEQLLQSISALSSMGGMSNASGAGLATFGLSTISLRGLQDDRTLVLVNGRRVAAFASGGGAAVNVNSIPLAAIERIEVLKDGASGIYGSDAIAGVVNFILIKDFRGVEVGGSVGTPTRSGGGKSRKAFVVAGIGDSSKDRYNLTASVSVEKETTLFARDREFAKSGVVLPFYNSGATGQGNIEGGYTPGTGMPTQPPSETGVRQPGFGNSPGTGYGNPLALSNRCESIGMFRDQTTTTKGAPFCTFDSGPFVGLVPEREAVNFSLNGLFKLTSSAELFGDVLFSRSKVTQPFQASPLRRSFLVSDLEFDRQGVDPVLLIRPSNPNYSIAADYLTAMEAQLPGNGFGALIGQPLAVTARVFDFGNRTTEDTATQVRVVGGVRGQWLKQDYELAAVANRSKVKGKAIDGYFSQIAFARAVSDPASDYDPWSSQQSAAFASRIAGAEYVGPTLDAEAGSSALEGKLSGELFAFPAGPAQYAAGVQVRREDYKLEPAAALATGDIAGFGGATLPIDKDRRIDSLFAEVNVPIVRSLEGNLALRNDRYDDVGNSTNYKASLRWQPLRQVLLRASAGSGFRAPTLEDLHEPQALGSSAAFTDPATGQTNLQVNERSGGNPDLKPEKSRQRSVGVVLQPIDNFMLGLDYFQIRVNDIITIPSVQEVVSGFRRGDATYANSVTLTPGSNDIEEVRTILVNTGNAKVSGVDVEAAWRSNLGPGRLDLSLSGTYMIQFDQTSPGGTVSHKVGTIRDDNGDPVLGADDGGVVLRWKHVLAATWTQGPWAFTLAQNFFKGYQDGLDLNGNPHGVPDLAIYDAQIAFTGIRNLKLALGAKNVFDRNPPQYIPVSNQFQNGYDVSIYDPRARFVYFSASYKF